ncbi:MAG: TIGR02206 family membrane protein [Oscillospiraceae bacterium]|jgi:hypothetical integral membrane protein (TIGR02206 family)|nr:TIGR02206 family membrane protein [Oscillospiraceae bacterium]
MQQLFWIAVGIILICGIIFRGWNAARIIRGASIWLAALVAVQIALVPLGGASILRNALPFHLCSFTAMLTIPMLWRRDERLFQFCWYLGMPGALLALIFPAVGYSPWPQLARALFLAIHAVLFMAPILLRALGMVPRREGAWYAFLIGNALLIGALIANRLVDTNYMFLSSAPTGTPLVWIEKNGKAAYIASLECAALVLIWLLSRATARRQVTVPRMDR